MYYLYHEYEYVFTIIGYEAILLRITASMEIGSCHFHRTVFKLPSLISFSQRRLYFPHWFSFKFDIDTAMNQSIQDGIRMCGVSEHFVPVFHRQLAHYDNWVSLVHQIHYFQQVTALFWWESERGSSPLSSRSSRSLLYSLVRRLLYLPSALSGDNSKPCIPVGRHYVNATIFDRSLALTKYEFGFIFLAFSWCFRQRIPSYTPTI